METPFFGWSLCCVGAFFGSLAPTFFSKQENKLVVIWFFSFLLILFGSLLSMLFVSGAEDLIGIFVFEDPDFAYRVDPTGIWSMIISIIIPTTVITVLLRLYEKYEGIG